ncbi:MAG: adenosylcobinamide-GDP ribazoletransferase [Eubacterium sp.]|nr:adenosylcobinamide-GDP ribazoletransferase [Eubacterium sp.]
MGFRSIIKSIGGAFSLFSRIPVPQSVWKGEAPRYMLGFYPWVGAVIGGGEYLMYRFLPVPVVAKALLMAVFPLILTGGIHVDGFMDTADAFHSYADRKKKLQILSDPHIGAFAVIRVLILAGLYLAGLIMFLSDPKDMILQDNLAVCFALSFPLARCGSGLAVIYLPPAKEDGMAAGIKKDSSYMGNKVLLYTQALILIGAGAWISSLIMTMGVLALIFVTGYFVIARVRPLGGITGDLAGWYLTVSECAVLLTMTIEYMALTV